ncbi:hypothetical protein Tco_1125209 [Tanacetum coccineum]|uniref:Uncharacterized protein n=1 Tax=Tanacetum coccineum TaxID=301880 RepID=A0ABQ5J8V6_9ASTR
MAICTNLSNKVLALEQSKTAFGDQKAEKEGQKIGKEAKGKNFRDETLQDCDFAELDVDNAMENVEGDAETQGRNSAEQITTRDTVNTATIDVSADGPSNVSIADPSTSTTRDVFEDVMMTIVDTLVAIRSTRPRTTSVIIHDVEEEPKRSTPAPTAQPSSKDKGKALMVKPKKPSKNLRKVQIQMDEELAIRLNEEEKAELERMQRERAAQEEASNATLIAEFDNVQARMEANALLAARLQEKEKEQFSIDEQARFLKLYEKEQKWIKDFISMDSEEGGKKAASSKKRPRAEPDEESVKRQKIRETSVEELVIQPLQVRYPIIDWEVYSEDTRRYWRIIRVGNHTEAYQIFADMWKKFERDDLKLQRYMHDPFVWRLYDTCDVHHVSSVRGHDIFMLFEKEYPLTRGTLGLMMVARLLVEANSEMSRELLRKIFYQANRPRK